MLSNLSIIIVGLGPERFDPLFSSATLPSSCYKDLDAFFLMLCCNSLCLGGSPFRHESSHSTGLSSLLKLPIITLTIMSSKVKTRTIWRTQFRPNKLDRNARHPYTPFSQSKLSSLRKERARQTGTKSNIRGMHLCDCASACRTD